ncbi:putative phage tail protein [Gluconacetobacter diazotrophicus]|uniref:putative phage tail protein n=1 Tax=Gluconacetobacter diazotrophicus TaxID=33996 RepID=UPI0016467640|nr:putative phage tail protein [Gluconacetobacter diazotrophicus]
MSDLTPILFQPITEETSASWLVNVLPEGEVWEAKYDQNSVMYKMLYSWMSGLVSVDEALCFMIDDANPSLTQSPTVLSWYQNLMGLPDKCVSTDSTFSEQQSQVVARMGLTGGMTAEFYQQYAQKYGLNLEIIEYNAALCGLAECGADSADVGTDAENLDFCVTFIVSGDYTLLQCELNELLPSYINFYFIEQE